MNKISLVLLLSLLFVFSCVKEKRKGFKDSDLFSEFESQPGFVILNLPPVLFKVVISSAENISEQKDFIDRINVIKVLLFEENQNSIKTSDLISNLLQKIPQKNFNLLTQIAQEKSQISIYVIDENSDINEILFMVTSEKEMFCIECIGKFKKEDAFKIYKSINLDKIKSLD